LSTESCRPTPIGRISCGIQERARFYTFLYCFTVIITYRNARPGTQIELVDFGAPREYSKEFMDSWLRLLQAGAAGDREACIEWSLKLGYLTGEENEVCLPFRQRQRYTKQR
jgi:predicted unusual protein kinase regulating ubiquinone biosynthesis (AarF/ABC1/UbiB family)